MHMHTHTRTHYTHTHTHTLSLSLAHAHAHAHGQVGDGCLGSESGVCGGDSVWWHLIFLYGHGQISSLLYDQIVAKCGYDHLKHGGTAPAGCNEQLSQVALSPHHFYYLLLPTSYPSPSAARSHLLACWVTCRVPALSALLRASPSSSEHL